MRQKPNLKEKKKIMLSRHENSIDFCNMKEGVGINEAMKKGQEGRLENAEREAYLLAVQYPQGFLWVQNTV